MRRHLDVVSGIPMSAAPAIPRSMAYVAGAIDAQVWVRHAEALMRTKHYRLRHTDIDNAPAGRDVHWNSAWAWTIAGAGWLHHTLTGRPMPAAMERATIWLPPAVLFLLIVLVSGYLSRSAGALAGAAVSLAMVGHEYFADAFTPSYVDHHGLIAAAVFVMVLGVAMGGAGWWSDTTDAHPLLPSSERDARRWMIVSAIAGAFGMWISAASVIPAVAFAGASAIGAGVIRGRAWKEQGVLKFDVRAFRLWGRIGAAASLAFYVIEYVPAHIGWRMEVNHPLYALAWLGGGELIASTIDLVIERNRANVSRIALASAACLLPLIVIIAGGSRVFLPADPFLAMMHSRFIAEFRPLWGDGSTAVSGNPWTSAFGIADAALIAGALLIAKDSRRAGPALWFATLCTALLTVLAWTQVRWLNNLSGSQIVLALLVLATIGMRLAAQRRWALVAGTFAFMFLPSSVIRTLRFKSAADEMTLEREEKVAMLYRDAANFIRAREGSAPVTLLASPNASVVAGYYGDFRTIGTFYWENRDGLEAAADMLSSPNADSVAALIKARGVTHIAMFSEDNFLDEYSQLRNRGSAPAGNSATLGYLLMAGQVPVPWLQPLPYQIPEVMKDLGVEVHLYRVAFNQSPDDALYASALAELRQGSFEAAAAGFDSLIARLESAPATADSTLQRAYMGRSVTAISQRDWQRARTAALSSVSHAPTSDRSGLVAWFANQFVQQGEPASAIELYRAALARAFNPDLACALAFRLSTVNIEALRSGREALQYARRAAATNAASPTYLNCLATSLAETGDFAGAADAAERAAANARAANQPAIALIASRLAESFRQHRPWRE